MHQVQGPHILLSFLAAAIAPNVRVSVLKADQKTSAEVPARMYLAMDGLLHDTRS